MNKPGVFQRQRDILEQRLRLLAAISTTLIFDYDVQAEELRILLNADTFFEEGNDELMARIRAGEFSSVAGLLKTFIHKKDMARALKAQEELLQTGETQCRLRFRRGAKWVWGQAYCLLEYDEGNSSPVSVFGCVDDIAAGQIQRGIIEKFVYSVSDYFIYLDIAHNFYIRFSGAARNTRFTSDDDNNYADAVVDFVENNVVEEDREYARAQMQPAKIMEVLDRYDEHSFYVGMLDTTGYRRKQLKYVYFDREKQIVLLTRFDVTSVYEEEREYNRKLKEALALAQKDPLTGLYNKSATEQLIKNALASHSDQTHALMMLDIDNFKGLNDTLGHMFGDAVLTEMSLRLKRLFRNSDIVGRVGGDEFTVLMTDIDDATIAVSKAAEIVRTFRHSYAEDGRRCDISCSVGLTLTRGEHSFSELYLCADKALYTAKSKGKSGYHLYDEAEAYTVVRRKERQPVESALSFEVRNIPQSFFEILYTTEDTDSAVNMALALIGELYNLSRVYVFEQDEDRCTISNTYEWCNKGIDAEKHLFQRLPLDQHRYFSRFNADGVLHCPNVDEMPPLLRGVLSMRGIRSLLQVLMMDSHEPRGFVGFDECHRHRVFAPHEVESLAFAVKVLGTFILKKRFADQRNEAVSAKVAALDCQPHSIYVVDGKFRIVYANKPLMRLIPSGTTKKCYELFRKRTSPCDECPVVNYVEDQPPREIYNDFFNIWVQVGARRIPWEGVEDAVLLSCVNVTNSRRILE